MDIKIVRTEQWEWTASYAGISATGGSEQHAELQLLRELIKEIQGKAALSRRAIARGNNIDAIEILKWVVSL